MPANERELVAQGEHLGADRVHQRLVTAHRQVRAPYRNTDVGYQVRLPRGTWVYCRTSCSETLRVNTIDVWANVDSANPIGVGTLQQECGIAGCLHWEFGF